MPLQFVMQLHAYNRHPTIRQANAPSRLLYSLARTCPCQPLPVPSIYSIGHPKRWPGPFPLQDGSLLAKSKEFCVGRRATDEEFAEDGGEGFDDLMPVGKGVRG